jgi:hypothetical protein
MTCTHNCDQGDACTCRELPVAPGDGFTAFDYIMRWLWTGMAWLGRQAAPVSRNAGRHQSQPAQ